MKSWKVIFGLGGACAACCALPLLGGVTALGAGSSVLLAGVGELAPVAWAAGGLVAAASVWLWRRRLVRMKATCGCASADEGTPPRCGIERGSCQ